MPCCSEHVCVFVYSNFLRRPSPAPWLSGMLTLQARPEIAAQLQEKLNRQRTEAKKIEVGGRLPCINSSTLGDGDGDDESKTFYTWTQNSIELYVYLPLEEEVRLRDIDVAIEERSLSVSVMNQLMIQVRYESDNHDVIPRSPPPANSHTGASIRWELN